MPFEVHHDWQASLATPRPLIGERAKTRLLLLLCFLWISLGLLGHEPWKQEEAQTISTVKHLLQGGSWAVPQMAGTPTLNTPPLYAYSATLSAKLLSPWLGLHDAARLASGVWIALTLILLGLTGREMWGIGAGRQTVFIFLGALGLVFSAHLLSPAIAGLSGYAMAFYGLALSPRRPWRAGALLGTGIGIAFLATGLLPVEIIVLSAVLLPLLFRAWRRKSTWASLAAAVPFASPWLGVWLYAVWQQAPGLLAQWLTNGPHALDNHSLAYLLSTLSWSAWPALPLAAWGLWHFRSHLLQRPQFQLALVFFTVSLLLLGFGADSRQVQVLPLLLPITLIASSAIDTLRRGLTSALDWFGIMLFGTLGALIWTGWLAMVSGMPAKLAKQAHRLSPAYVAHFDPVPVLIAGGVTLIWVLVVFKSKRSNRAVVTDWAVGMTMAWGLLMTLWLPWLDAARNYQAVFGNLQRSLPAHYSCVTSRDLGDSQRALLDYYLNIRPSRYEADQHVACDLYLIQDERNREKVAPPGTSWHLIWQGKRASDRRESFRLYQYRPGE